MTTNTSLKQKTHQTKVNHPDSIKKPSRIKLVYDICMLIAIIIDLIIISIDGILMSHFAQEVANWLAISDSLAFYRANIHFPLSTLGGFFTIFLIVELLIRWGIAIKQKEYYRWFFFPFVHWYEVLGCFPQLRALRLLRAIVIGRRLHQLGHQVLPQSWIETGKFYYNMILEELSDRVILTATDNIRQQMMGGSSNQKAVQNIIDKNRADIETMIVSLLRQEVLPKIQQSMNAQKQHQLSIEVGQAVQNAIKETPELSRYVKMIPIAGGLIESQILHMGQKIGENVTANINQQLFSTTVLDELMQQIAHGIAQIDTSNPQLEALVINLLNDAITAFEEQVKVQQWKHQSHLSL